MSVAEDDSRLLPVGSTVNRRLRKGVVAFDRVHIERGPYFISHNALSIAVTTDPLRGYARVNAKSPVTSASPEASFTLLRPGDQVNGLLEQPVGYEVLLVCPSFMTRNGAASFVQEQDFDAPIVRRPLSPLLARAWTTLRDLFDEHSDVDGAIELVLAIVAFEARQQPGPVQYEQNASLALALSYIDAHLGDPIDVKSIAASANLSQFYFNRLFREFCQTSIYQFVLERRLDRARQLLASTELPISAIAQECGFSSQSHLTHTFGQKYGVTPAQYRLRSFARGHK